MTGQYEQHKASFRDSILPLEAINYVIKYKQVFYSFT